MFVSGFHYAVLLAAVCGALVESRVVDAQAHAHAHAPAPLITPAPAANAVRLARRQVEGTSTIVETCGYQDANVLSPRGCFAGSSCFAEPTLGVAGGCCRLGDGAKCRLATSCVAQADLTRSCDGACTSNDRVARCDSALPFCYTNFWPSLGQTLLEIGCTTAPGQFFYAYSTYTGFGGVIPDLVTATGSPIPTLSIGNTAATASGTAEASPSSTSDAGADSSTGDSSGGSNNDSGGSSTNVGAIAGGAVGGVAALGLVAALITWIILRNRRKERAAVAAAAPAAAAGGGYRLDDNSHDGAGNSELKAPVQTTSSVSPVSPASSSSLPVPARKPVGQELPGRSPRHEVAGHADAQELQHQQRFPELP